MKPKQFHVYIYRDPTPGRNMEPFYVGHSGRSERARLHWNQCERHTNQLLRSRLIEIRNTGQEPIIEKIGWSTDVENVLLLEIELIAKYGRLDQETGTLCNLSDGGEGASGEAIRKLMESDPEFARIRGERMRKLNVDPEAIKRSAECMRKLHADPEFAKRRDQRTQKMQDDPEYAKARDERTRKMHADPEFAKRRDKRSTETMRKLHANPEFVKVSAECGRQQLRKLRADPEFVKAQAEQARKQAQKLNADPKVQANRIAGIAAYWAKRRSEAARNGSGA